jgi:serine/threonine protein kinase
VGPYRLLGEIGRGGMSVVYRAERADGQFRSRVAIKFLRGDIDAEELHARLAAERQILAGLDHPNIARLLDGGLTDEGRPYLVMEYVEGRPVTTFALEAGLSVEARLALFLEIAGAVRHAHSRLVIHRDLKPSNILVTPEGRVRLLDFGIAKVLDQRAMGFARGEAPKTRTGMRLFTPEYASPEQVRGEPGATSNDVWALGCCCTSYSPERGRSISTGAHRARRSAGFSKTTHLGPHRSSIRPRPADAFRETWTGSWPWRSGRIRRGGIRRWNGWRKTWSCTWPASPSARSPTGSATGSGSSCGGTASKVPPRRSSSCP